MVCEMMHGDDMTRPRPLSEAERLLEEQSADLDGLFFDIETPTDRLFDAVESGELPDRPKSRADCAAGPRPCPWVMCRHHLYLDVRADGVVRVNFPNGPETMLATCALDLADDGPRTLDQVSILMGMSRERVRQLEERALVKLRFAMREGDLDYEGSDLEAQDGAEVIEETVAKNERAEAIQRKRDRRAEVEARKEARQAASLARNALASPL
jgi:hypothetical protein